MSNMIAEKFVCLLCVEKGAAQQLKALPKEQLNEHVLNHMEESEKLLLASSRCTNCHLFFETRASKVVHEESGHKTELIDAPGNREEELKAIRKRKELIAQKTRVIIVEQDILGEVLEKDVAETSCCVQVEEELQEVHEEQHGKDAEEAEEQQGEDVEEVEEFPVYDRLHEEEDQQEGLEEMATPEDDQPPQLEAEGEVAQKNEEDSESNEDEEEDEDGRQTPLDAIGLHNLELENEREAQERKEKRRMERDQDRLQQPGSFSDGMLHLPKSEQLDRFDEVLRQKKMEKRRDKEARLLRRGAPKTPVVPPLPKKSGGTGVIRERPKIPMTLGTPRTPIRFRAPPSTPVIRRDSEESLPSTVENEGRQEEEHLEQKEEVEVLKKEEELGSEGTIENPVESGDVEAVDEKKEEEDEEEVQQVQEVPPEGSSQDARSTKRSKSTPLVRYSQIPDETSEGQGPSSSHAHHTRSHGRPIPMGQPRTERSLRMAMATSSSSSSSPRPDVSLMGPPRTERSLRMAMGSSSSSSSRPVVGPMGPPRTERSLIRMAMAACSSSARPDSSSAPSSSSSAQRQSKKVMKRNRREELRESLTEFEAALKNKEDLIKKKKHH